MRITVILPNFYSNHERRKWLTKQPRVVKDFLRYHRNSEAARASNRARERKKQTGSAAPVEI